MQVVRKLVAVEADESFAEDRESSQGHDAAFALADERRDPKGGIEEEKRNDLLQDPKARIAKQSIEGRGNHARQRGVLRKELSMSSQREHILMVPIVAVAAEAAELVFEDAKFGRLKRKGLPYATGQFGIARRGRLRWQNLISQGMKAGAA